MRTKRSRSGLSSRSELSVVVAPRRRPEEKVWRAKARPRLWSDAEPLRLRAADTRSSSVFKRQKKQTDVAEIPLHRFEEQLQLLRWASTFGSHWK